MASGTTQTPFDLEEVTRTDNVFYDGYWQNENYFLRYRDTVIQSFHFPAFSGKNNLELADALSRKRAASCHVRRGDYLLDPIYGVCSESYYKRAINELNTIINPELYCIFSDDIDWCKNNLSDAFYNKEVVFVNWNSKKDSFRDMQLMSLCHYNIIANSSFSWWGAWLNNHQDKIVLAPERWMNKPIVNDPICDSWKRIKIE